MELSTLLMSPLASLAICLIAFFLMIWPGYAVLHIAGYGRHRWRPALYASPSITLALLVVVMSGTAWGSIPFKEVGSTVWIGFFLFSAFGLALCTISFDFLHIESRLDLLLWSIAVIIPFSMMPTILIYGLGIFSNSTFADGWSYIAFSDYLLHAPRGVEGGLSPLDQYASHLMGVRNASSSIIAYISMLLRTRPDEIMSIYCMILIFANASALNALAVSVSKQKISIVALVLIAGFVPAIVVHFANFDQMLLMPFAPTLAAISINSAAKPFKSGALLGLLIAASWLAYVEMAPLAILVALSFAVSKNVSLVKVGATCICAALTAVILDYPSIHPLFQMLESQVASTHLEMRPGEGYFYPWASDVHAIIAIALVFAFITIYGAWVERHRWGLSVALGVLIAFSLYLAVVSRYAYGLYKVLTVNSWLLLFLATAAVEKGLRRYRLSYLDLPLPFATTAIALLLGANAVVTARKLAPDAIRQIAYRQASEIRSLIGDDPVLISVRDPIANEWAVFYLSESRSIINPYRLYMAQDHVLPYMNRALHANAADIRYIVTDRDDAIRSKITGAERVWNGTVYTLWKADRCSWQTIEATGLQPFTPSCSSTNDN